MKLKKAILCAALVGMTGGHSLVAGAAVSIDSVLGEGNFDFSYGSGGTGSLSTVFSGPFGVLAASNIGATGSVGVTNLALSTAVSGAGSNMLRVDYTLNNLSGTDSFNLGMIALVDPNGGDPFFDVDRPTINFPGAVGAGEPVAYGVDDFFGSLNAKVLGGSLDNSNNCGAACDLQYALQWDLGLLAPGGSITVSVGLSDSGLSLSTRNLLSQLDGGGIGVDPSLTLSGAVSAVPLPAPALLLGSALAGLLGIRRRGAARS